MYENSQLKPLLCTFSLLQRELISSKSSTKLSVMQAVGGTEEKLILQLHHLWLLMVQVKNSGLILAPGEKDNSTAYSALLSTV